MLSGVVTDPTGATVAGASVKAYDSSGSLVGQAATNPAGASELRMLPEEPVRLEIELAGFVKAVIQGITISGSQPVRRDARLQVGSVSESVTVTAAVPTIPTESASMSRRIPYRPISRQPATAFAQAAAFAQELGDLFEYKLKEPISILKNRSALAPIVQSSIDAEKVSIWNEQAGMPRPQRALWIANSSGLTLDGGSFSVLEEETGGTGGSACRDFCHWPRFRRVSSTRRYGCCRKDRSDSRSPVSSRPALRRVMAQQEVINNLSDQKSDREDEATKLQRSSSFSMSRRPGSKSCGVRTSSSKRDRRPHKSPSTI